MGYEPVACLGCGGWVGAPDDAYPGDPRCGCVSRSVRAMACPCCAGPLQEGARACPFCHATVATCRCDACLAWSPADARYCQACGEALGPAQATAENSNQRCPHCRLALTRRAYADLAVLECDPCGGMFLDPAMLARLERSRDNLSDLRLALPVRPQLAARPVRYVPCPVCDTLMNRRTFARVSGVVVDVCKAHGVWFDAGELAAIVAFVRAGGLARARERAEEDDAAQTRLLKQERARASVQRALGGTTPSTRPGGEELWHTLPDFLRDLLDAFWNP